MTILLTVIFSLAVILGLRLVQEFRPAGLKGRIAIGDIRVPKVKTSLGQRAANATRSFRKIAGSSNDLKVIMQMPDILELISVAMAAGEGIYGACKIVLPRAHGAFAKELGVVIEAVELGSTFEAELEEWGAKSTNQYQAEFANKLRLTISRGTPIAELLNQQAESIRHDINTRLLGQAGKNETKMLVPLVFLILPVTVLFAIYPSLQLLNLNYLNTI